MSSVAATVPVVPVVSAASVALVHTLPIPAIAEAVGIWQIGRCLRVGIRGS